MDRERSCARLWVRRGQREFERAPRGGGGGRTEQSWLGELCGLAGLTSRLCGVARRCRAGGWRATRRSARRRGGAGGDDGGRARSRRRARVEGGKGRDGPERVLGHARARRKQLGGAGERERLAHQREPTLTSSSSLASGCVAQMAAQGVTGDLLCLIVRPHHLPRRVPAPPLLLVPSTHPRLALPDRPQSCSLGPVGTARTLSRRLALSRTSPRPRPRLLQRPPRPPTREPARRLCRRTRPQVRPAFLLSVTFIMRTH